MLLNDLTFSGQHNIIIINNMGALCNLIAREGTPSPLTFSKEQKMIQNHKPNLISIFVNFHILNIPSEIGGYGTLIFQSLLWKANQLRYPHTLSENNEIIPVSFKMSNGELCDHSGLKYNAMYQARQSLADYRYNGVELITYIKGKKDEMANYTINYPIFLQPLDNNETITEQEPDKNQTITEQQKDNNDSMVIVQSLSKHPKNQYINSNNIIQDNIRSEKIKNDDDLRNGYLSNEIIEYSPEQLTIISLLNQKYCTTFDGGMGTKYFQYVKELSILPIEKVLDAIETSMIAKKEESLPKILPYIVAVAKKIEESSQPKEEKKIISEEKQLQNAKSKFYTQMNSINIEEFIITGESDMYPQGRLGTLKLIFNDLENNVQLYHFVKQRNPEYLVALDNMKAYMEKKEEERRQGNE